MLNQLLKEKDLWQKSSMQMLRGVYKNKLKKRSKLRDKEVDQEWHLLSANTLIKF
jgi:hypothetical protein